MKKLLIILAVIGALAGFGIYKLVNAFGDADKAGDAAISAFHTEYNANRAAAIFTAAAPAFQKDVKAEDWNQLHAMLHEKLGQWQSGERTGLSMNNDNGKKTLKISASAKFEKGEAKEEFVFDYNGDTPLLLGYNVESPALKAPPSAPAPAPEAAPAPVNP